VAAGQDIQRKREQEAIKDQFEKELRKVTKKLEAMEKSIGESNMHKQLSQREILALQEALKNAAKDNAALAVKMAKFAEAAGETEALKQRTKDLKTHLRECTIELDLVATKYKEE
jgi:uncharacterized protein YciW